MHYDGTKIIPRYSETDQMGVIYHSNYFVWFEVARGELLKQTSIAYQDLEAMGVMLPVIEVSCKYKISAKYADHLIVKTQIKALSPVRIQFYYEIIREMDQVLIAQGLTEHVFLNKENGKPFNFKKKYPAIYEQLENLHSLSLKQ